MTQSLFKQLSASSALDKVAQHALDYWRTYGALNQIEAWRWTPLTALRSKNWAFDSADYQFSLPAEVEEGFSSRDDFDARLLALKDAPFAGLNVALLEEVLTIRVAKGSQPAELIALDIDQMQQALQFSRINLIVEEEAVAAFWFDYRCGDDGGQIPVIHLDVHKKAKVDGAVWLTGGAKSPQLAFLSCEQHQDSEVNISAVQHNGALIRMDINAQMLGDNAYFSFGGVQDLRGNEIGDYHVTINHHSEASESRQVVRGALADKSFGIFDGLIYVSEGAQRTDAKQDSRYILLSPEAKSHSVPRLEIYADDVQCAHGSTVGFLDPDALFYLQSRGISADDAQRILVLSFLHEAVVVSHPALVAPLQEAISQVWMDKEL